LDIFHLWSSWGKKNFKSNIIVTREYVVLSLTYFLSFRLQTDLWKKFVVYSVMNDSPYLTAHLSVYTFPYPRSSWAMPLGTVFNYI
jgi:hypothetical protein